MQLTGIARAAITDSAFAPRLVKSIVLKQFVGGPFGHLLDLIHEHVELLFGNSNLSQLLRPRCPLRQSRR